MRACVRACVCVCVWARARLCVRVCMCACVCEVFAFIISSPDPDCLCLEPGNDSSKRPKSLFLSLLPHTVCHCHIFTIQLPISRNFKVHLFTTLNYPTFSPATQTQFLLDLVLQFRRLDHLSPRLRLSLECWSDHTWHPIGRYLGRYETISRP